MRIAHLGVVIDSSGARKGAEESKAALVDVGATAERAAKARVAATDAVTGAAARNTTAQRLNNADISASVKRYDDMIAAMKRQTAAATGVTQANRQVTDSTRAMGLAHAEAIRMNDALGKSGGVTNSMLNRLRPGFSSLATQVLGTNSAVGALGGTIGQFSIGAGPTIAILAGIAAVSAAYTRLTAHTRAQAEEQKKATKAALDFAKGQREGVGQGVDAQIGALQKLIAQQKLFGEVARGGKVSASQIAEVGLIASLNITLTDPAERTRLIKENEEALVAAKDRLRKLFLQANRDAESDRNAALASLAAANEATVDEQKETVDRLRALRQLLAQNTAFAASSAENASATRGDRVRLIAEIKVLGDAYDGLAKSAEKRATAEKKAADEVIDFAKRYEASLASVRKGIQEYDDAEEKKRKTLKDANETIALSIEARQLDIETMREQVAVANDISGAFSSLAVAREQEKAVAAARAKLPDGEALSSATTDKIREQVKEYYRLKAVLDALNELKGKSPFAIPERDTKAWADSLQLVAREAGAIAGIFGGIGTAITKAVQLASQFVASMGAAQKAAKAAEAAKGTAGAGAANSAAQGASLAAGVNFATLAVTGIKYWHDSVRATSAAAEQAAIALRELGNSAKKAATSYVLQATGTQLDQQLAQLKAAFQSVITDLLAAGAPRTAALGQRTAKSTVPTAAEVDAAIAAYDRLVAAAKRAAAFQAKQADEELAVRLATAQGRTAEAEAIRQQIRFEKELEEARLAGASAALLAQIALVQAAEAAFAARQKARTANEFGAGLTAREQSRAGNNRGAFVTRQGIDSSRELNAAADMVAAGTITAEMFERLKVVIGEEMVDALKAFDAAVAAALQAQQEDLAIRTLLATGNEAGAAALRREIANRKELEGVTDVALIAQIKYVQGLEAIAIVQAAAAAEAQRIADLNAGIDRRMIDAYRTLDPIKAAELEKKRVEIERTKEIAAAGDAATAARLAELHALEDQAAAMIAVTSAIQKQIDAAQKLADFNSSVEVDYLRATGRNFEADKLLIEEERTRRLKENAQLGGNAEGVRKINVTFDAKLNKLIASTIDNATPALGASGVSADVELITRSVARSISSVEAIRLLDVATSQLAVLQVIATNTESGSGGGVRINVTVQGGAYAGTPADVGRGIAEALAPMFDDALGRRVGVARRLTGADAL